jgi:hypothetical protein
MPNPLSEHVPELLTNIEQIELEQTAEVKDKLRIYVEG